MATKNNKSIRKLNDAINTTDAEVSFSKVEYYNTFTNQVIKEVKRTTGKNAKQHSHNEITGMVKLQTLNGGCFSIEVAPNTKLNNIGMSYAGRRLLDFAIMDITSKVPNKDRGLYTPQDIIKYTATPLNEDLIAETFGIEKRQTRNNIKEAVKNLSAIRDVAIPLKATFPKLDKNNNPIRNKKGELVKITKDYVAEFKSLVSIEFKEQSGTPKAIIWDANFLTFIINSSNLCPRSKEAFKINGQKNQNAYDIIRYLEEEAHQNHYNRCVIMSTLLEYCSGIRKREALKENREAVYERLIKPIIRDLTSLITLYGLLEELTILDENKQGVLLSYKLDNETGKLIKEVEHPTEFKTVLWEDFTKLKIKYKLKDKEYISLSSGQDKKV